VVVGRFPRALWFVMLLSSLAACSSPSALAPSGESDTAAGGGLSAAPDSGRLRMQAKDWTLKFSPGMPRNPRAVPAGWAFDFPTDGHVGYLVTDQRVKSAFNSITAVFSIDTAGNPFFDWRTESFNTCPNPATVRLFVQRKGDDMSGDGPFEFYRWWSNPVAYVLAPGDAVLVGDLTDPAQWTSVFGRSATANEPAFRAALADIGNVGFTFGGGCFFGHGVFVTPGTGSATFTAAEFTVR
jgi:hypothetical protein